jgi:disulfide bond formation protein DsbB
MDNDASSGRQPSAAGSLTVLATLVSLAATAGSLWLSVGMKLKACPLCFYQRTFVMAVAAMMLVGLAARAARGTLCLLAVPAAAAGFGVAAFHVWLELSGRLECPAGVMGLGSAPQQSTALLGLLFVMVVSGAWRAVSPGAAAGVTILGGLMAWGCIASAPPLPPAPAKAYETPMDMCRPPFRS